jgi:mannose-6-phosphate isomerase
MSLAPFLLSPALNERVWGGSALGAGIGEAWDLSVHPHGEATVSTGPHTGRTLAAVLADQPEAFGGSIDLLAKRLDCAQNLSVQVHPPTGDPKTEAWVVLDAQPGAGVYLGFVDEVDRDDVARRAVDGTVDDMLQFVELKVGDAVFVPAGTVHAIGGGLLLFELQQSSDTTYRLYDWGREGRELHLDEGLAVTDLGPAAPQAPVRTLDDGAERLVECDHFVIDRVTLAAGDRTVVDPGHRWLGVFGVSGVAHIGDLSVVDGITAIVPGGGGPVELVADTDCIGLRYGPPIS